MKFRFCGDLDCPDWVLSEIATLSKMSSIRIKVLVVQILSYCIQNSFNYEKVLKLADANSEGHANSEGISDIKGSVAAVHFIITNAAKYDLDEISLVQEIQQLGLPKENSEQIARQYREHKDTLRARFADESYKISSLKSIDWRVDTIVASSKLTDESSEETSNDAVTLFQFKLSVDTNPDNNHNSSENDRIKDICFEVSEEKLNVLIHELSNAHTNILLSLQS